MTRKYGAWSAAILTGCSWALACGGQHTDGDSSAGGSIQTGGAEASGGGPAGGASTGGEPASGGAAAGGAQATGGGPALPEGCIPLVEQPDGTFMADARLEQTDELVVYDYGPLPEPGFVEQGSYTERFCGVFQNYDRLEATALPGPAPSPLHIVIQSGPGRPYFTGQTPYARLELDLSTDAPLGSPVVQEFMVGGIRNIQDLGNVRLIVKVVDRVCDYDQTVAPVYGQDGYVDARGEQWGLYGSYFPRGGPNSQLCADEFVGDTACAIGLIDGESWGEVVQYIAQEKGEEPQLWTPPREYVGFEYAEEVGELLGISDGETTWWVKERGWRDDEIHWSDFETAEGAVYAREPILSVIQRFPGRGRTTYCALPIDPLFAAGARPDCQQLVPGENRLTLYADRYSAALACYEADEGQVLTLQVLQAVPSFGISHLGPESSYRRNGLGGVLFEFSDATPTPTVSFTAPAGLNAFLISSQFPNTHENTPLVLNFTVSDP